MKERFKVESILTKEVLYEFGVEMDKKERIIARILLVAGGILNIIYCIRLIITDPNYSFPLKNVIAILVVMIMAWKLDKIDGYIYLLMQSKRSIGKRQALLFYDDYLRVNDKANYSYSEIKKVTQTEKGFIIMYSRLIVWVANESFTIGDPCEFKKFLQEKFKGKIELSKGIKKNKN